MASRRRIVLAGILAFVAALTTAILSQVLATVFFAITIAYVLSPLRERLVDRGLSPRAASGLASLTGLGGVVAVVAPLLVVLYQRRFQFVEMLQNLPDRITIRVGELVHVVDVTSLLVDLQVLLGELALDIARASPVLALKLTLLAFLVYGLLVAPRAPGRVVLELVPSEYHDVLRALDRRVEGTLRALYVIQAATAIATFLVSLVVFSLLGYSAPLALAVVAGILQFIPIVGPSLLVLGLAAHDLVLGDPTRAALVFVLGMVVIGFLPDAVIRPRMARQTTHLPASVYFVGFTGGVLSLGVVGVIAGPLAVALLVEAVQLFSASGDHQTTLAAHLGDEPPGPE